VNARAVLAMLALAAAFVARPAAAQDAPAENPADDVSVSAKASKTEVMIGEPFSVEVTVSGPPGIVWTFPAEAGDEHVELRTVPSPGQGSETPAGTHRYEAAAFALNETQVPAISIGFRRADGTQGAVSTQPLTLRILSTLPKDPKEQKLADIRGPQVLSISRLFWALAGVAAVAVGALIVGAIRRRRPRPVAPAVPVRSPEEIALAALDRLRGSGLLARAEYRPFYIELAAIAKRYLEQRLGAPVLEMTSAEAVGFLRAHPVGSDLAPALRDLAGAADRVKFARGAALADEAERHLASVRGMVRALEERLRPPAEPSEKEKVA
jgi:hypothetical protein